MHVMWVNHSLEGISFCLSCIMLQYVAFVLHLCYICGICIEQ